MMNMMDEKQNEVYEKLEGYIKKGKQNKFKTLVEKHGISYFKNFKSDGVGLLHYLFIYDLVDIMEWIVGAGWDVNELDKDGQNLLFYPKKLGLDFVEFLIQNGINVNHIGEVGYTPILNAIPYRDHDLVKMLYQNGADINAIADDGAGALELVIESTNRDKKSINKWIDLFLNEPNRCDEDLLKRLKSTRLENILV